MTKFKAPEKLWVMGTGSDYNHIDAEIYHKAYTCPSVFGEGIKYTRTDLLKQSFNDISEAADKLHSLLMRTRDLRPTTAEAVLCMFKPLNKIDEILKRINDND